MRVIYQKSHYSINGKERTRAAKLTRIDRSRIDDINLFFKRKMHFHINNTFLFDGNLMFMIKKYPKNFLNIRFL